MLDPNLPALSLRLSCVECGTHVMVPLGQRKPGGQCGVCESYDLVPLILATAPRAAWLPVSALAAA
jgi:hypothetical protein